MTSCYGQLQQLAPKTNLCKRRGVDGKFCETERLENKLDSGA